MKKVLTKVVQESSSSKVGSFALIVAVFTILWFIPHPEGLSLNAWHLFVIFVTTIFGLIIKPLPMGAMALIGLCVAALTNTLSLETTLSSFSSKIVWLIVSAFLLARGFIKTGLGVRIAYYFISTIGKSTLGLAYGLTLTELIFAPAIPSNTARGGGIIYPIVTALSHEYGSDPKKNTQKKIGSYLIKLLFQVNVVTSALFLTSMAANPIIVGMAMKKGIAISWISWAVATIVPGLVNLALLPLFLYYVFPPIIKHTPEAQAFAKQKLKELGSIKLEEIIMVGVFILLLTLWIMGDQIGISATTAAFVGLSILLITGVLTWDDITKEHKAWDTFVWMAILIMFSSQIADVGITDWFSGYIRLLIGDMHWMWAFVLIYLCYFYMHYLFAGMTAFISSLFGAFLTISLLSNVPPFLAVIMLGTASSLSAGMTHYGTGSAPVFFGSNYVSVKDWWRVGGITSLFNIAIWFGVGGLWWKILGYW